MTNTSQTALERLAGLADAFELLRVATSFPAEELARAAVTGALADDARSCLEDCGMAPEAAAAVVAPWTVLAGGDAGELWAAMKRGHSLLHVRQGAGVAVWPYESAFIHRRMGMPGEPALFRTHVTLAVEASMRTAGVLPEDYLVEPCDSVWDECSFIAYLLGDEAAALASGDGMPDALAETRRGQLTAFVREHVLAWLPEFFDAVADQAECGFGALGTPGESVGLAQSYYRGLAAFGRQAVAQLEEIASETLSGASSGC